MDRVASALPAYEIGGEIARGAWGVVLAGRHRRLGREVAIKQLPPAFAADPEIRARFGREARVLALLDHPHIVPLYDYVEQEGLCLLVMEHLPGGSVAQRSRAAGFTMQTACAVGVTTCLALDYAHRRGVLHRDIKPGNLLYSGDDALKVTDFGVAKMLGGSQTIATRAGDVLGTPAYMAPEQAAGGPLSPSTDVYATGVLVYELLSGHLPHDETGDVYAMLARRIDSSAVPITDVRKDVPYPVAQVVMRALATSVSERFESARAFSVALKAAASAAWGDESDPATTGPADRKSPRVRAARLGRANAAAASADQIGPDDVLPVHEVHAQPSVEPGMSVGDYVTEAILAPWALGSVLRARQARTRRIVAMKLLARPLAEDDAVARRFVLGGMRAARLDVPRVAKVLKAGESSGVPYVVAEFVEGTTLESMLVERGRLGARSAVAVVASVAAALDAANELGYVHGDVCPSNIFVDAERRIHLSDFAITSELALAVTSALGSWPSSAEYVAPELSADGRLDAAADVYALGMVAVRCIAGRSPRRGGALPEPVIAVLKRATAERPRDRYGSARELARELRAALGERPARCRSCREPILSGDRFCGACGAAQMAQRA